MTGQPPVQPPHQPAEGNPPTQPMPATSTRGRNIGLVAGACALAALMLLGFGLTGLAVLRFHDRVNLLGDRGNSFSRFRDGPGSGLGPGADDGRLRGMPGGRVPGPRGLGSLLGATALHGTVTAIVAGSVQALVFQRGEVTAVSATSITLKSSDGFVGTYRRTTETSSRGADPVKGGQAFVVARASNKVAITTRAMRAKADGAPTS